MGIFFGGFCITGKAILDMNSLADLTGLLFMIKVCGSEELDTDDRYNPKDSGMIVVTKLYSIMSHPQ